MLLKWKARIHEKSIELQDEILKGNLDTAKEPAGRSKYCNDPSTVSKSVTLMKISSCESEQTVGSLRGFDGCWTVTKEKLVIRRRCHLISSE